MHLKFISFISGAAIILAGCAGNDNYTPTGKTAVQAESARYMTTPNRDGY